MKLADSLRKFACALPDVEEGVACEGTSLEKRTLKLRGKSFLFLGPKDLMLKLGTSLPDAAELAEEDPATIKAGSGGWVTVKFGEGTKPPPLGTLKKWARESYDLFAAAKKK